MVQMNRQGAIDKLNGIIEQGRARTTSAIEEIQREWEQRRDVVVPSGKLSFEVDGSGVHPVVEYREADIYREAQREKYDLSPHAYRQVLERAKVPKPFADKLLEMGEHDLLRDNLQTLFRRLSPEGALLRRVGTRVKGFLSTSYSVSMDAAPVFEGFVSEAIARGFVPYRGLNTDSRMSVTFLYPKVFEPKPGEFVVYGASQTTGDYGGVANSLEIMALRIFCDNLAVGFDVFRRVHIGSRLQVDDGAVTLSRRTKVLDSKTVVSATRDAVKAAVGYFEPLNGAIAAAAEREPDVSATLKALGKKGVRKEVLEQVEKTYAMEMPVEVLPQGQNAWRLSNVLSLLAKSQAGDDKVELESAAFSVLGFKDRQAC